MLIPYTTDALLYHYPIATGGLIGTNVLIFAATWQEPDLVEPWLLHYGQWNPLQWVSSVFLHADVMHLLGNMVFLWIFGLIVEGKIGWWRLLLVYLGIGAAQSGIEQTLMLGADEGASLGASAAIYGLMAVAMVWAPLNDVTCLWLIGWRAHAMDIKIWVLAFMYLAYETLLMAMSGFGVGSEMLHLMGAGIGAAVGIAMVTRQWVDCENWDVISVARGRHQMTRDQLQEESSQRPEQRDKRKNRCEQALKQIQALTAEGNPALAYSAHEHCRRTFEDWSLSDQDLLRIVAKFHELGQWRESIPAMVEYVRRPEAPQTAAVRLRLARVLLEQERRPAQALRVLAKIPEGALNESQSTALRQLRQKAAKMHDDDPYEVALEDW